MVNRGRRQYTQKEKELYRLYGIRSGGRSLGNVRGQGRYHMVGRPYIRGQGGYFSDLFRKIPRNFFNARDLGSKLGAMGGKALGDAIAPGIGGSAGSTLGSALGGNLGAMFKNITGFGSYNVKSNTLMPNQSQVVPSFGDDSIRVKKREFVSYINATTAFNNNSFPVNPGLSDSFPWLSAIANNYEQYRWNGLIFEFVSTSSDAIASTTNLGLGQVIMASDYNSADDAFQNAPQMLGSMFSNSGKPSENILHAVECAPTDVANKLFYIRSGDTPTHTDIRLYDMLNFQIATQNMPANYTGMGQLWVSYDITLCKSVQNNQLGFDLNTDKYIIPSWTNGNPLGPTGGTLVPEEHSNLGTVVTPKQIAFPVDLTSGYYLINIGWQGNNASVSFPTTTGTGCTKVTAWSNDTAVDFVSPNTVTSQKLSYMAVWRIDTRDAAIDFSSDGTLPVFVANTPADLLITQVNGELFGEL